MVLKTDKKELERVLSFKLVKRRSNLTMVLAELGGKLRSSLQKLQSTSDAVTTETLNAVLSDISRALIESDVNVKLVMTLRSNIQKKVGDLVEQGNTRDVGRLVQKAVIDELTSILSPNGENAAKPYVMKRNKPNVILFVGLQGAGKTTSIAKFAHYYQRKGWKTAMVCADTFRAGAFDQLKQNATKLRIHFMGVTLRLTQSKLLRRGWNVLCRMVMK
jgi:signal recognition particle subunit SRP54